MAAFVPFEHVWRKGCQYLRKYVQSFKSLFLVWQVYFGTSHPRSYISANLTGFKCVTGMSCLMRKDVLDQAGGLIAFAQYIAEDYFMAKAIADR